MAVVPIIKIPDEVLTQQCAKVKAVDDETKQLIQNLLDTLSAAKNPEGAGLAAPQIGSLKRVCVVRKFLPNPDGSETVITKDYVLVNPKLISASEDMDIHYEGCLSIPDTYGQVKRHKKIKVSALDENGNEIKINTSGFFARVIQHEMDHLDGILFTSKMIGKVLTEQELDNLNSKDSKTVSE